MKEFILAREKREMERNAYPLYREDKPRDGTGIPDPDFSKYKKPDKTKEERKKETDEGYKKSKKLVDDIKKHQGDLKEWGEKTRRYWRDFPDGTASGAKNFAGLRPSLGKVAGGVFFDIILDPLPAANGELPPVGPPGAPNEPPEPPDFPAGGDQVSICGKGDLNPAFYNGGKGGGFVAQIRVKRATYFRSNPAKYKQMGICKYYCNDGQSAKHFEDNFREELDYAGVWRDWFKYRQRSGADDLGYWVYTLESQVRKYTINYMGKKWFYKWLFWSVQRFGNKDCSRDPVGYTNHYAHLGRLECIVPVPLGEKSPVVKPNDYDRKNDEEEMGCQWQKDEVDYSLPELKIGDNSIGGNQIKIDDGLVPLANFLCKSIEMLHKGLGLNQLGAELPKLVSDRGGAKIKPSSLAELTQWQFDNVSSLVGLPVETAITNLENSTKDIAFRNVQDCISFMFQQQKESDLDLMVIENYCTRIAQQLEAVTQIALRQQADIEMLVKELGFRWKWETKTRKSLYKIGMSDEDEKTGILELFKGGEVSYPVRVWDDKLDSRQIAMTTNLYSEIASKSNFHSFNTDSPIPGLDARSKMSKTSEEDWKEWVKGINTPEKGTISGGTTPYIEEYSQTSITAKKIAEPASGLSLFMKPKKAKVTGPK